MQTVVVDQKGRVMLPLRVRKRLKVSNGNRLLVDYNKQGNIVLKLVKTVNRNNKLLWRLQHPLHVSKDRIASVDLEKVEEEMWLP